MPSLEKKGCLGWSGEGGRAQEASGDQLTNAEEAGVHIVWHSYDYNKSQSLAIRLH